MALPSAAIKKFKLVRLHALRTDNMFLLFYSPGVANTSRQW